MDINVNLNKDVQREIVIKTLIRLGRVPDAANIAVALKQWDVALKQALSVLDNEGIEVVVLSQQIK